MFPKSLKRNTLGGLDPYWVPKAVCLSGVFRGRVGDSVGEVGLGWVSPELSNTVWIHVCNFRVF